MNKKLFAAKSIVLLTFVSVLCFTACEYVSDPDAGTLHIFGNNVDFGKIDTKWTQDEITGKVKLALSLLSTQSQTLLNQYTDLEVKLRSEIGTGDNYDTLSQIQFAVSVQNIEQRLFYSYGLSNALSAKQAARSQIGSLLDQILAQFPADVATSANSKSLFKAQVLAFQQAHYLDQRAFFISATEKASTEAAFAETCAEIDRLGGQHIRPDSLFNAIHTLEFELKRNIPANCGPVSCQTGLIQQFEDIAQFDAWTDDLSALGYSLSVRW